MTCPCPGMLHKQGRDCACSTNASRAVFGMKPLEDEPLVTQEDTFGWLEWIALAVVLVTFGLPMLWAAIDYYSR